MQGTGPPCLGVQEPGRSRYRSPHSPRCRPRRQSSAKKVSNLHALHDELARNNVHVHNYVLTRDMLCMNDMYDICDTSLDERESESVLDSIRAHSEQIEFDVNIAQSVDKFSRSQILLGTCAGESVFRDSELFYSIVPSTNSLIVNEVNIGRHPLILSESGETDF